MKIQICIKNEFHKKLPHVIRTQNSYCFQVPFRDLLIIKMGMGCSHNSCILLLSVIHFAHTKGKKFQQVIVNVYRTDFPKEEHCEMCVCIAVHYFFIIFSYNKKVFLASPAHHRQRLKGNNNKQIKHIKMIKLWMLMFLYNKYQHKQPNKDKNQARVRGTNGRCSCGRCDGMSHIPPSLLLYSFSQRLAEENW